MNAWICVFVILVILVLLVPRRTQGLPGHTQAFAHVPHLETIVRGRRSADKITVLTVSEGDRPFAQITLSRLKEYCKRHGYKLVVYSNPALKESRDVDWTWLKIPGLLEVLSGSEGVMWIDDDIYITNMNQGVEDVLGSSSADIFIGKDGWYENGRDIGAVLNAGILVFRNTEISRSILQDAWDSTRDNSLGFNRTAFHEQRVLSDLIREKYSPYVAICDYGILQSFHRQWYGSPCDWKPGHFSLHLCGVDNTKRAEIFGGIHAADVVESVPDL